jgi:hypothetical protein
VCNDDHHIAQTTSATAATFPWGYKLLACLLLDYSNSSGKYSFVTLDVNQRSYFVFSLPKIKVILDTWYCVDEDSRDQPNLDEITSFFDQTFFDEDVADQKQDFLALVPPFTKTKILFAMATKFNEQQPCSAFDEQMAVVPVSFVLRYITEFPLALSRHEDAELLQLQNLPRGRLVICQSSFWGQRSDPAEMSYPPVGLPIVNNNVCVNTTTGAVDRGSTGVSRRKTHKFVTQEYHNFPVSEEFLADFGGELLHKVLRTSHDLFNHPHRRWNVKPYLPHGVPGFAKMFTENLTAMCHKDVSTRVRSGPARVFAPTWDLHGEASRIFDSNSGDYVQNWISNNLVKVPYELRSRYSTFYEKLITTYTPDTYQCTHPELTHYPRRKRRKRARFSSN